MNKSMQICSTGKNERNRTDVAEAEETDITRIDST